jgi:HEAT repeat protein
MSDLKILGDSPTTEDGLGFDSYVDILLDAIRNFDAASSLTIGIHGSWGSGKTSLMRMLEKRFEDDTAVKTIWFNAWAQGQEESIGLALLYRVLTELQKKEGQKEKIGIVLANIGKLLVDAGLRRTTGITLEEAQKLFEEGIEIRSTLRDNFEAALAEGLSDKRLVVFTDDLDRCLPEKTIEILEVIKLFLDLPRCVFVIGVAKEMIEQGFAVRYKTDEQAPIHGKDYIEKIIQVPFTLPPIREADMTRFIEGLGISEKEKEYATIVAKGTGCNPRRVKLFLNTLRIRQEIAERTGGEIKPEILAKLLVIEHTFPDFYKDVVRYRAQGLLCTLELVAKGELDEELREKLEESETLQKYYRNEDLQITLKVEPFFCGVDIEPYIYLAGKPPEEYFMFHKSVLDELLSGDSLKIEHAKSTIKSMPELDQQRFLDIIRLKLKEGTLKERRSAAIALGRLGDIQAVEPLIKILESKNEDPAVRLLATRAIGKLGDARSISSLIEALKDEDEEIRMMAAEALGIIGDAKAVDPLIAALKDKEEYVRKNAAEALAKIDDSQAVGPLMEVLADGSEMVRHAAVVAIGEIGDPRAVEPLIIALKDESKLVRGDSAYFLGEIGDPRAAEPLLEVLNGDDMDLIPDVIMALGKIGDGRVVEPSIKLLNHKNERIRSAAAQALGQIGDVSAVVPLIEALRDEDDEVRGEYAEALGNIGDVRAIDHLKVVQKDWRSSVSKNAKEAIENIKAQQKGDKRRLEEITKR